MELSNIDYINISVFFISVMLSIIFYLAWRTIEPKLYTLMWSLLFATAAINGLINAAKEIFPNTDVYWVIVNATSLLVQWFALAGFRYRSLHDPFKTSIIIYFICVELLIIWFTLISPHMGLKMLFAPISGGIIMLACVWEIINIKRKIRPAEKAMVILLIIYSLVQVFAGLTALMQGAERNEEYLMLYLEINYLLMPASLTGLGLFTVLILADDLSSRMKYQANSDPLTNLLNRRGFYYKANLMVKRAKDKSVPISIIITDIDYFKQINDTYGHKAGDLVLKKLAAVFQKHISKEDIVARIGGEEFVLLLYSKEINETKTIAEKIREHVQNLTVTFENQNLSVTLSFGIVELLAGQASFETKLNEADKALYNAKRLGRNRVEIY
jgi:diguanylate cyclase (GGDEF)-like protein